MAVNTVLMIIILSLTIKVSSQCEHGEVRLVNGSVPSEGRVEICINSTWGTVCDMMWDTDNAKVVCRQLGYTPEGAIARSQAHYGQGDGRIWLDNVRCTPAKEMKLLECPHRFKMPQCNHTRDAGVRCVDEQDGVKNISATIINPGHTIMITWDMNNYTTAAGNVPTMFEIECSSEDHSIAISVNNESLSTSLGGFLSSTSYTCCVAAVYESYTAKGLCTEIEISNMYAVATSIMTQEGTSNSTNVVGGVLGFIIAVLLILLILSGIALVYLSRPWWKERLNIITAKVSTSSDGSNNNIDMPICSNLSYEKTPSHSTAMTNSRTHSSQGLSTVASATNQHETHYSCLGPDYETIDSRRQISQRKNQVHARAQLLSERYEYSEAHLAAATDGDGVPEANTNYEVPLSLRQNMSTEGEDYAHLEH